MGTAASTKTKVYGIGKEAGSVFSFVGTDSSPLMVARKKVPHGYVVMIDVDHTGKKDEIGVFADEVTLKFGVVTGVCAAVGNNVLDYTVRVDDGLYEVHRKRFLLPLNLPELSDKGIEVGPTSRQVGVEIEWQGGKRFGGELVSRDEGKYEVRFLGGKREVLTNVPIDHLHPIDDETCFDASPDTLAPDPLWMLDRKIQADIDAKWPMKRRIHEVLEMLRREMRPPGAQPLRGPFVGENAYDSEGFPAHPYPIKELTVDGAFVDTWGKFAGKCKFATTYKIGPSYPRMDAWVDTVDAGDPLYFHAALPVYAGLICLGMFKNPGDPGPGQPEWIRASDVALVGVALYADGVLLPGAFAQPQVENDGYQRRGHDCCHFVPGCVSTYFGDSAWIGGVFCLAPSETDYELCDDIYTITEYHQLLREGAKRPGFGSQEIDIQVNLLLTTNYLANVRQVCSGSVRVTLSDQGLAMAYERMKHVQEKRLRSEAALNPKRGRKVLSEVTYEEAIEQHLVDYPSMGLLAAPPSLIPKKPSMEPPPNLRGELETQFQNTRKSLPQVVTTDVPKPPAPPGTLGTVAHPPPTPEGQKALPGAGVFGGTLVPMGSAATPIRGPEANLPNIPYPPTMATPKAGGWLGSRSGKTPAPPRKPLSLTPTPPKSGFPPPPQHSNFAH